MHLSPTELRRLADDIDDTHRDAMRTFAAEAGEHHFGEQLRAGRRSFLARVAAGGAALSFGSALVPVSRLLSAAGAQQLDDIAIAAFAESVELSLVAAYDAGLPFLSSELTPVAETFASHHREHADVFGGLAGDAASGQPNAALMGALAPGIDALGGTNDVLAFVKTLENQAVATYAYALTAIEGTEVVTATASILPIESAHAAALSFALGEGPEAWFPFGAFESADIVNGLDPAVFPVG